MAFLLTLLGTDTKFTAQANANYTRGETLSVTSHLVTTPVTSDTPNTPEQFRLNGGLVIDGPNTLGTNVGEKISEAVIAVLNALSRRENTINVIAHSRGAVQAILVAHELKRIKDALNENSDTELCKIIKSSPCLYTQTGFQKNERLITALQQHKETIRAQLDTLELSIFAIDPVPGGNWMGLNTGWKDERFYTVPSNVKRFDLYTYANERSRCFKVIVPDHAPTTAYHWGVLPGHHGTGSGNFSSQQMDLPYHKEDPEAAGVQLLLYYKLISFLEAGGHYINFSTLPIETQAAIKPIMPELKTFTGGNETERNLAINACYDTIHRNRDFFLQFNDTSYRTGLEGSVSKYVYSMPNDRLVHYHNGQDTALQTLTLHSSEDAVNAEHAMLWMHHQLGLLNDKHSSIDSLKTLNTHFENIISSKQDSDHTNPLLTRFLSLFNADNAALSVSFDHAIKAILSDCLISLLHNNADNQNPIEVLHIILDTPALLEQISGSKEDEILTQKLTQFKGFIDTFIAEKIATYQEYLITCFDCAHKFENPKELDACIRKFNTTQRHLRHLHTEIENSKTTHFTLSKPALEACIKRLETDTLTLTTRLEEKRRQRQKLLESIVDTANTTQQAQAKVEAKLNALKEHTTHYLSYLATQLHISVTKDGTYPPVATNENTTLLEEKYHLVHSIHQELNDENILLKQRLSNVQQTLSNDENGFLTKHRDGFLFRLCKAITSLFSCLYANKTPGTFYQSCHSYRLFSPRGQSFKNHASQLIEQAQQTL